MVHKKIFSVGSMMCVNRDGIVYFNAHTHIWDVYYPLYYLVLGRNSGVNVSTYPI